MRRLVSKRWPLAAAAILTLAQCGGKTDSSKVDINPIPTNPIVITANSVVNGATVTAPWFKFRLRISNNASQQLTIVGMTANVYPPNSQTPTAWAVDPTSFSSNTSSTTTICNYTTFGTINAGNEGAPTLSDPNDTTGTCGMTDVYFTIGGLPPPPTGSTDFTYRVDLTPVGWFGSDDNPQRFDRTVTFYTR